jgi:hypothetical protein
MHTISTCQIRREECCVERLNPPSDNGHEGGRLGRLLRDEAFLIAVNIAKLPSVPRQILKDIPRPPNSASRDD